MFEIEELFDLTIEGAFESPEDFNAFASQATPEELFSVMVEGAFESPEELLASFKKKDETDMDSVSGAGFSVLPAGEKDTWLERTFGKTHVTDFFGDMYRSMQQGLAQGATVDDALKLFYSGKDVDEEDVRDYISAVQNMEGFQPSDEMKEFDEIYQKEGGGIMGFLKGVYKNPTVIPQIFTSSMFAMANKGSLATGLGTGAAAGLATGGIGAIPGAIFGLSGALETGVSFTEFLKEELGDKAFTEENIKEVLEDQDALNKIRRRAGARGISIASIDALTAGVASKVGASVAKTAGKAAAGATRGVVEAVGGGVGEAAGRGLAGQEMDVAEIGFEAIGGTATAPVTIIGRVAETGMAYYKLPKYKIRNVDVTKEEFIKEIESATPEEILSMDTSVKNDEEVSGIMNKAWKDATIIKQTTEVLPSINEEELAEIVELTKRKELLEANGGEVAKAELPQVNNRIKEITNAVRERSTKTPPVPDQPKVGEEVGERDTAGEVAGEVAPEEGVEVTEIQKEKALKPTEDKGVEVKALDDSQVPKQLESFEVDMDGEIVVVKITTNLDGSRKIQMITGDSAVLDEISKDNTLSNKEYVEKAYGPIKSSESIPIAEVLSQKKIDRLSAAQKEAIGLKEKKEPFETKRVKITEPFTVGQTEVVLNEDGTIKSATRKGQPVSGKALNKIEKIILRDVIDIDAGEKAPVRADVTEENIDQYIADESNNIREIAFSIQNQRGKSKSREQIIQEAKDATKLSALEQSYFTLKDLSKYYDARILKEINVAPGKDLRRDRGVSKNIKRYWVLPETDKFGRKTIGISDFAKTAEELGLTPDQLVDIIVQFPTRNVLKPTTGEVVDLGPSSTLMDLENNNGQYKCK